tara:strand:+ start:137 stop:256 length:120 start_codon:yes stop_codon:yes gene_type:complete
MLKIYKVFVNLKLQYLYIVIGNAVGSGFRKLALFKGEKR